MSFANFIPTIWNAQMLTDFRQAAIAANLCNRSYEGNATAGNTVKVTTAAAVAVKDYKAAGRTTTPDAVGSSTIDLLIDQEKNFDFTIDDIDRAQVAGSLEVYTASAGEGLAEDSDKFLLAKAVGEAGSVIPAATLSTADDALDLLRDMRKAMNKAKVPAGQRVVVYNAEFEALLLSASSKITNVDRSGSPAGLRDASLGRLLGFDLYGSENLPITDRPQIVAWYTPALAYVSQIEKTEAMRATNSFADRMRGLHVYGGKVVRPTGVAAFTAPAPAPAV